MQVFQQVLLLLHRNIADSHRFKVIDRFLSEKYGLLVITNFGNCCSFLTLTENKEIWKKNLLAKFTQQTGLFLKIWISMNTALHQERVRWYGNLSVQGKRMDETHCLWS